MKYSSSNPPLVCMLTTNPAYKANKPIEVKGVLWHSTGCNNPNLKRYVQPSGNDPNREQLLAVLGVNKLKNDWGHTDRQVGVNAFIGKLADGTIAAVQTQGWSVKPWGCGSGPHGSCNNAWCQFEICESNLKDADYAWAVYREACELTAYLCKMFNLDPHGTVRYAGIDVPVILDHKTSHDLGLGSNHGDVAHFFPKVIGKTLADIRDDVAALLAEDTPPMESVNPSEPAAPTEPESPPGQTPDQPSIEPSIQPSNQSPVKPPQEKTTGQVVTIINSTGYVNIRNGNGTNFVRITTARNGEKFPYIATAANGWHAILTKGQVCWVSGDYSKVR